MMMENARAVRESVETWREGGGGGGENGDQSQCVGRVFLQLQTFELNLRGKDFSADLWGWRGCV